MLTPMVRSRCAMWNSLRSGDACARSRRSTARTMTSASPITASTGTVRMPDSARRAGTVRKRGSTHMVVNARPSTSTGSTYW